MLRVCFNFYENDNFFKSKTNHFKTQFVSFRISCLFSLEVFCRIIRGRPKGFSSKYQLIASEVKEMYDKEKRSTEEIKKIFKIKSQPTSYRILHYVQTV